MTNKPVMTGHNLDLARRLARDILQEVMSNPELREFDNYGDMHDVCDANCLGGTCEEGHFIHGEAHEGEIFNHAQTLVNDALSIING